MLAIAIISLVVLIISLVIGFNSENTPNPYVGLFSIAVISWWNICFPLAIILLIIGAIWVFLVFWSILSDL